MTAEERARELRTPGEDAWLDEIMKAGVGRNVRERLATILRAYRANLLSQSALLTQVQAEARLEEAAWWRPRMDGIHDINCICPFCLHLAALAQAVPPAGEGGK